MLKHIKGNIFDSDADIIIHQVNCQGVMDGSITKEVQKRYPAVYKKYKAWCDAPQFSDSLLGKIQSVNSGNLKKQIIVNMFSQNKYGNDKCYTDYDALKKCLEAVNRAYKGHTVAVPYLFACYKGGGNGDIVSKLLEETLTDCDVTLYEHIEEV